MASVGDKALPVVTGEPGNSVVIDEHIPERSKRAEGRISGRVYDENGDPLSDVRVRLAVGNAPGGNLTTATTDRTGAFTLPGLRPGTAYTVIAEWEDGQDYLSGRSSVRAPDTDVRITLNAGDAGQGVAARAGRVKSVSDRELLTDPEEEEFESPRLSARKPRVNLEDLPPAPEAESFDAPARAKAPAGAASPQPRSDAPAKGVHWRAIGADGTAQRTLIPKDQELGAASAVQDFKTREAPAAAMGPAPDDEGPNPLPPALEPVQDDVEPLPAPRTRRRPSARTKADRQPEREPGQMSVVAPAEPTDDGLGAESPAPASDGNPLPPAREPGTEGNSASTSALDAPFPTPEQEPGLAFQTGAPAGGPAAAFEPEQSATPGAAAEPFPQPPPGSALAAALPGPVEANSDAPAGDPQEGALPGPAEAVAESSPFETSSALGAAMASVESEPSVNDEPATTPPPAVEAGEGSGRPADGRKRPTWGELAALTPRASIPKEAAAAKPAPPAAAPAVGRPALPTQTSARAAPPQRDDGLAYCDYDPKHRKINDFRLPDLEGRPVRFQDLDADLVLIDFWGTWCQPCLKSVPHLVDLQKRMDPAKVKVVGIACEQGPPADRARQVAQEVKRLGINYSVLLSGMDGACPLQEALKVQTYPTLILVDRQGRVIWREQGATPATLARLDRIIASTKPSDGTRRF